MSATHDSPTVDNDEWPEFDYTNPFKPGKYGSELPTGMVIILNEADFQAGGNQGEWIAAVPQITVPLEETR